MECPIRTVFPRRCCLMNCATSSAIWVYVCSGAWPVSPWFRRSWSHVSHKLFVSRVLPKKNKYLRRCRCYDSSRAPELCSSVSYFSYTPIENFISEKVKRTCLCFDYSVSSQTIHAWKRLVAHCASCLGPTGAQLVGRTIPLEERQMQKRAFSDGSSTAALCFWAALIRSFFASWIMTQSWLGWGRLGCLSRKRIQMKIPIKVTRDDKDLYLISFLFKEFSKSVSNQVLLN